MLAIPILYRYLMRQLTLTLVAICAILLMIIVGFRLSSLLGRAASGALNVEAIFELIALQSLRFLVVLLPLSFVLAAALVLAKMYREQEITAILAAGISRLHIVAALFFIAAPLALLLLYLNLMVLPKIYQQQDITRQKAQQEAALLLFNANTFRYLNDNLVVYSAAVNGDKFTNLFIAQRSGMQWSIIYAQEAQLITTPSQRQLILHRGKRYNWDDDLQRNKMNMLYFKRAILALPQPEMAQTTRLRNLTSRQLNATPQHQSEWQQRLNAAIALCVFTTLIPLLVAIAPRGDNRLSLLLVFVVYGAYFYLLQTFVVLVKKEIIAVYPGSFTVHLIFLIAAFAAWRKR